jgi:Domain of unknown function (DUF4279)
MDSIITQIKLIFLVFGESFNQDDFTKQLGVDSSSKWNKGDDIKIGNDLRKSKSIHKRKDTAWEFTEGYKQTFDFEDLTKRFEELFSNKVDVLKSFTERYNLNLTINVVVEIANGEAPSLSLSKSFITLINEINSEIDFDLYVYDKE